MTDLKPRRWWVYSNETGCNGTYGPWGPIEAPDINAAEERGAGYMSTVGMTLARVLPVVESKNEVEQ